MSKIKQRIVLKKKLEKFFGVTPVAVAKIKREDGTYILRETGDKFLKG